MSETEDYLIELSEKVGPQFWDHGWNSLSHSEQVFVCVWQLESSVNNGGFDQFYTNSDGDLAVETVDALKTIGAEKAAEIVRQANALFEDSKPPKDRDERQDAFETIRNDREETLEKLDADFFTYPDNLSQLLYDFVIKNRNDIRGA